MPIDRADHRFPNLVVEIRPRFDEVVGVSVGEGFRGHLFDVSAGSECFLATGEDGGADGGIGVNCAEGRVEVMDEGGAEGV